jgi:tetratricopeptide (TPR) repeat protein
MAPISTSRVALAVFVLSVAALAQSTPQQTPPAAPCPVAGQSQNQPSSQTSPKPCTPSAADAHKPSAAEQFPFPGEPAKAAKAANPPDSPDAPGPTPAKSSAADDHPFPTTPPPRLPGDDSSSSSSSSSSSGDDTPPDIGPPLKDEGTEGTSTHRKLPKPKKVQTDDERVDEDLSVARFYMGDDNLPGAYLRAEDAVKVQPDYSNAHFTLAQVAQKMKKKDEAVAEYKTYLKLDPEGEKKKDAQRALEELK